MTILLAPPLGLISMWSKWRIGLPEDAVDAVIVPGGGLDDAGQPLMWVQARLDAALQHDSRTTFYLVLSRGTTHKPAPLDADGFAVDEAVAR